MQNPLKGKGLKTAQKVLSNPLGAVSDLVGDFAGSLGLGKTKADYRKERYRKAYASLAAGDWAQVRNIANNSQYADLRVGMKWALAQKKRGATLEEIEDYLHSVPNAGAITRSGNGPDLGGGSSQDDTSGPAPDADESSAPPTKPTSTGPAQRARKQKKGAKSSSPGGPGKKKRSSRPSDDDDTYGVDAPRGLTSSVSPCKYGQRGSDGKCPCKYGPRVNGLCPKKPTVYQGGSTGRPPATKMTKAEQAALRKATAIAEKTVMAGVAGATKAISAALSEAGISGAAAAGAGVAIAAAGAVGWLLGRALDKDLSGQTEEEVKVGLALDRIHARIALAKKLGVFDENAPGAGLSKEQQQPITDWYNKALAALKQDRLGEEVAPDQVAYDLYRSKLNAGV